MAQLSLGTDRKTGRRRIIRRRAPDGPAAERALRRLQHEWGVAGDIAFERLDDYLDTWLDNVRPSIAPATFTSYRGHVELHIAPVLGHLTVGALRPADVHRLIGKLLEDGKSPSTVQRVITTLRMALGQAVRDGELTVNVAGVRLPKIDRVPVEAMTPERAQILLDAVKGDWLEPLYVLLLGTGLRLGEACALDWRDLELQEGSVFVRKGKTRAATRTIPLAPFVVKALVAHRAAAPRIGPDVPVFLGPRTSERLRTQTVSHAFPKLLERHELPAMRVHDLRHATATLLLAKGLPMRDIASVLGHANPSVTAQVYAHTIQESRERAARLLEEAMG